MAYLDKNSMEIILSLDDRLTPGLKTAAANMERFASRVESMGRDFSQVGRTMAMFGAGLTGSFAVALKNAAAQSDEVRRQLDRLKAISEDFYKVIASSGLPVLAKFNNILADLYARVLALPPEIMNAATQSAILFGALSLIGGTLAMISGRIMTLIGNLASLGAAFAAFAAANIPLLVTVGLVAGLVALMFKLKAVADIVMSTFQVLFIFFQNGILAIRASFSSLISGILDGLEFLISKLAEFESPMQEALLKFDNTLLQASIDAKIFAEQDLLRIKENAEKIGEIFRTGSGEWAGAFDEVKQKVSEVIAAITRMGAVETEQVRISVEQQKKNTQGLIASLGTLNAALQGAATQNKSFAEAARAISLALAIVNTAQGITRALADYSWPFSLIVAGIIGAAGAIQIATISSQKFAGGTDSVPAMVSPGEMIFPRTMADAIRRGDIVVSGRDYPQGNNIAINVYGADLSYSGGIHKLAEELGFDIERQLRYARGL